MFLSARLPLTKTFVQTNGVLASTPYPLVSRVTSFHEEAKSLEEFKAALDRHAAKDHCLFGGQMQRPLRAESRAGMTLQASREWLVFDFDKVEAKDHQEVVAKYLPPECQNVSYVAQMSSSMFLPTCAHWSGHIFMLLKEPADAVKVKQWFEYLNFSIPALTSQITLSDSLQALHWPLDRTVAYESKLIYIAPPKCIGFTPAVSQHIQLVKKKQPSLVINSFQPIDSVTVRQKINELRRGIGEPDIDYTVTQFEGHDILRDAMPGSISGMRTSGDHYIRFNLNGGDSLAYFIDLRNPEIIRNFKGEPYLLTKQVDEAFYKAIRRHAPAATAKPPLDDGTDVLAFYATNQNSAIKVGTFNPCTRDLTLYSSNETAARAWRAEYGLVQKEFLPHYTLEYDPASQIQFVHGVPRINTFSPTAYMTRERSSDVPSTLHEIPPVIKKVITSILGDPREDVVTHFVNWVAFIFQTRKRSNTAWVLSGVEGSGKGSFVDFVLTPLFGKQNVSTITYANIKGEFNDYLENKLFVFVDEADTKAADNIDDAMMKFFTWIANETIVVRKMRTDPYNAQNFCNFIFNTNKTAPVKVGPTDRRFNFGDRQMNRWYPTPNELQILHSGAELETFADVLQRWPVNAYDAAMVIETEAKDEARKASATINEQIAQEILAGNLQYFIDSTPTAMEADAAFNNRVNPLSLYNAKLEQCLEHAERGEPMVLSAEDLYIIFRTLVPDPRYFQDNKIWYRRHFKALYLNIDAKHRKPGSWKSTDRGVKVEWKLPEDAPARPKKLASESVVTPIKRKKKT